MVYSFFCSYGANVGFIYSCIRGYGCSRGSRVYLFVAKPLMDTQEYDITTLSSDLVKLGCCEPVVYEIDLKKPIRSIAFIKQLANQLDTLIVGILDSGNDILSTILVLGLVSSNKEFCIETRFGLINAKLSFLDIEFVTKRKKLTRREKEIINIIRKHPGLKIREIAEYTGLAQTTIEKYLTKLKKYNLAIIRKGYRIYPTELATLID